MRTVHDQDLINELKLTNDNIKHPFSYVDSIIIDSHSMEMHGICIRFIRETTMKKKKTDEQLFTRIEHCVKEEKDISNKKDGYYYIAKEIIPPKEKIVKKENNAVKEPTFIFVVYEKSTYTGYFSVYPIVKKLFTLMSIPINKVIPKVFSTKATFDDFDAELKCKVVEYRNRKNSVSINTVISDNIANDTGAITVNHLLHNK